MLPTLRKLSRASEVIARMILLRAGSGRSHRPVFEGLTQSESPLRNQWAFCICAPRRLESDEFHQDALIRLRSSAVNSRDLEPTTRFRAGMVDSCICPKFVNSPQHGGFTSPIINAGNLGAVQSPQFQTNPFLSRGVQIMQDSTFLISRRVRNSVAPLWPRCNHPRCCVPSAVIRTFGTTKYQVV